VALGQFKELSVSEIEQLDPGKKAEYLRRKAARDSVGREQELMAGADKLEEFAGLQAMQAKAVPAELRQQLASSMMGLTGGGLAQGLGAMGQMAKAVTPAITKATQAGLSSAAKTAADAKTAAADARTAGVETATYMQEQGVGQSAAAKADIKQRIENIKKDKRNWLTGIDADELAREIEGLRAFYTDDSGYIDPEIDAYISKQKAVEVDEASGWDIF